MRPRAGLYDRQNRKGTGPSVNRQSLPPSLRRRLPGSARRVIDVGCGIRPQRIIKGHHTIAIDPYRSYLTSIMHGKRKGADFLFQATWDEFLPRLLDGSVDYVIALDVIEHMSPADGSMFLEEAWRVAEQGVLIFTPDGPMPQNFYTRDQWGMDGGHWQRHRSAWTSGEFRSWGWEVFVESDFHITDARGNELVEPIDAFWALASADNPNLALSETAR